MRPAQIAWTTILQFCITGLQFNNLMGMLNVSCPDNPICPRCSQNRSQAKSRHTRFVVTCTETTEEAFRGGASGLVCALKRGIKSRKGRSTFCQVPSLVSKLLHWLCLITLQGSVPRLACDQIDEQSAIAKAKRSFVNGTFQMNRSILCGLYKPWTSLQSIFSVKAAA